MSVSKFWMNNNVRGDKNAICLQFLPYLLNICSKFEFHEPRVDHIRVGIHSKIYDSNIRCQKYSNI